MTKQLIHRLHNWYQYKGAYYIKYAFPLPHFGCRFYPTCSEYTFQAIEKYGPVRGTIKGLWRILRCNPFTKGGSDYP